MRTHWLVDKGRTSDRDAVVKALGSPCAGAPVPAVLDAISTAGEAATGGFTTAEPRGCRFAAPAPGCRSSRVGRHSRATAANSSRSVRSRSSATCAARGCCTVPWCWQPTRGRVLGIDAAPALAMSGVARVLTAADVPGQRLLGTVVRDWPAFVAVGELTRCVGDVLALVVADTQHRAYAAAAAVQVDYEVLEPVTSPEQALAAGAPELHASGNILETCVSTRRRTLRWPPRLTP